jgi:hypothetical protein
MNQALRLLGRPSSASGPFLGWGRQVQRTAWREASNQTGRSPILNEYTGANADP